MTSAVTEDLPIPGSLVLVDVDGHLARPHSTGQAANDIVLSPTPSNDVNDPLRWSFRRKQIACAMLVVYVLTSGIACTSLYSVLVPISESTGIPVSTLNAGTGYMFLLLGWGGLITQPLAMALGKRPVYLVSQIGVICTVIWMMYIKSEGEWIANKIIQGFFSSPIEMLIEVSIADLFYAHERGFYIGVYGFALFGSNFFAPMISGFINDALGYKWVFRISAIQQAIGTVILFFFMEETNYNRGTTERGETHQEVTSVNHAADQDELGISGEKDLSRNLAATSVREERLEGTEYTAFQKMRMFDKKYASLTQLFTMMYRPVLLLRLPGVFWAGLLYGQALVWYNVLNATASVIFSAEPFNFAPSMVGLTYAGPLLGAFIAAFWSGLATDRFLLWHARRKGGMREPEDRLWLLILNTVICPAGLILWGVGAAKGIHWFGLVFGGGLVAFTSASGGAFALNYALDSYKDLSGEVMVSVILVRNTLSFAIGYGITPWLHIGYQNTFITAAVVALVIYLTFIPVIKFGKAWRKGSREKYWKYVESSVMPHI